MPVAMGVKLAAVGLDQPVVARPRRLGLAGAVLMARPRLPGVNDRQTASE